MLQNVLRENVRLSYKYGHSKRKGQKDVQVEIHRSLDNWAKS